LEKYSSSPFWRFREAVAANPNTPIETLSVLAKDPDDKIRWAVIKNPVTSEELLAYILEHDPNTAIREAVAEHPTIKSLTQKALTTEDPQIILTLANKPFPCVRRALATNSNLTSAIIELLFKDPRWRVRFALAKNPVTPWELAAVFIAGFEKHSRVEYTYESVYEGSGHYEAGECGSGRWVEGEYRGERISSERTISEYRQADLDLIKEVLSARPHDRAFIMERVASLKPELFSIISSPL
jgi:hypothetical protein